jgi:hypothetical protein
MSLQVLAAHSGERVDADPTSFPSLDAFKHWIARITGIAEQAQILLTARGKHVRQQALLNEVLHCVLRKSIITNRSSNRKRSSSSIVRSFPLQQVVLRRHLPRPTRYLPPSLPPNRLIHFRTKTTFSHGRNYSKLVATGLRTSFRSVRTCPRPHPSVQMKLR